MKLRTGGKPKTLKAIHPNMGLEAEYRRRLQALVEEMDASLTYWLTAGYRANAPELAEDRSPAAALMSIFNRLARRWTRRFDELAPQMASFFATSAKERVDATLKKSLKDAGFTVEFKLTAPANDALQAVIAQNVGLIKSIASEHLTAVQGSVMRSVAAGHDLGTLTSELIANYGITHRRAATIARHQNNIATATITRVRQEGLGITHAIWQHSQGGSYPRPSHIKAGRDKLVYAVNKGAFLDGVWVRPGEAINCKCVGRSIIRGLD